MLLFLFFLLLLGQIRSLIPFLAHFFSAPSSKAPEAPDTWPSVLIQIPAYNEGWVIKDTVIAALQQAYPADLLEVQVIDDSPEEDIALVAYLKEEGRKAGVAFSYLRRSHRSGFKSGALNFGMRHGKQELILVLDADFVIDSGFLRRCTPFFTDERLAGVQTRWTYRNQFENPTTALQAAVFENIFAFEQCFRVMIKAPALFTGTSGIWRRTVIESVGGWREQPFTAEDIDLTFRSYGKGYGFAYLDEALSSCEATPNYLAYKRQQQRWARGVFQAAIHNAGNIIRAQQRFASKLLEAGTLLYTFLPILLLGTGLVSAIHVWSGNPRTPLFMGIQIALALLILVGPASQGMAFAVRKYHPGLGVREQFTLYRGMLLSMGMGWSIVFGVLEVLFQSSNEFVVTPKGKRSEALKRSHKKWFKNSFLSIFAELSTWVFFAVAIWSAVPNYPETIPYFLFLALSGWVSFWRSLRDLKV